MTPWSAYLEGEDAPLADLARRSTTGKAGPRCAADDSQGAHLSLSARRSLSSDKGMNGAQANGVRCALRSPYRRACGNRRRWSGGDTQATTARVSRSRSQQTSACLVRSEWPRNPTAPAVGRVNLCDFALRSRERRTRSLGEESLIRADHGSSGRGHC